MPAGGGHKTSTTKGNISPGAAVMSKGLVARLSRFRMLAASFAEHPHERVLEPRFRYDKDMSDHRLAILAK